MTVFKTSITMKMGFSMQTHLTKVSIIMILENAKNGLYLLKQCI
jgi:hypothetical protein